MSASTAAFMCTSSPSCPIRFYCTPSDSPRSRLILRLCEAFVRSCSAVKPYVRYNFGITRFEPQAQGRKFHPRDDKPHVAKSTCGRREYSMGARLLDMSQLRSLYTMTVGLGTANLGH